MRDAWGLIPSIVGYTRELPPAEVAMIARDLCTISDHEIEKRLTEPGLFVQRTRSGTDYATRHLHSARDFAQWAASDGRGFAHLIG